MRVGTGWLAASASIIFFCCFVVGQLATSRAPLPLTSIVDALEKTQAQLRPRVSYQVIREYHLSGANSSKANSDVIVEVDFRAPASKDYRIQLSSGSNRGQQIVRRVLDKEVESESNGNTSEP